MADAIEKARRQQEILGVLGGEVIASQAELRRELKHRGFPVTQATLSRDLKEMRIPCVPTEDGRYRYLVPSAAEGGAGAPAPEAARKQLRHIAALEAIGIGANETGVVVRTLVGRAQGVAVFLDGLHLDELLATVAGDDTVLALPRSIKQTRKLKHKLAEILGLE